MVSFPAWKPIILTHSVQHRRSQQYYPQSSECHTDTQPNPSCGLHASPRSNQARHHQLLQPLAYRPGRRHLPLDYQQRRHYLPAIPRPELGSQRRVQQSLDRIQLLHRRRHRLQHPANQPDQPARFHAHSYPGRHGDGLQDVLPGPGWRLLPGYCVEV